MSNLEYKLMVLEETIQTVKNMAEAYLVDDRLADKSNIELIDIALKEYKRLMESPDEKE